MAFEEINVGDFETFSKTICEDDINAFANLTGDFNPVHVDEEYARRTNFKNRIAHGMFVASLISTVLGTSLPGSNTIYLSQEVKFKAPVFIGNTLTVTVKVIEKREEKNILVLETIVTNENGKKVVDGSATVMKKNIMHREDLNVSTSRAI